MTAATTDTPRVRFPPPLVFALAVLGGWWLDRRSPWPIDGGIGRAVAAWALFGVFLYLISNAARHFIRNRTSILPMRAASALVLDGPYRFTRNPMYLGMALLTIAFALWLNTWWILALLVPALLIINRCVIAREEAYLRRRFGAEYDAYMKRVRRWG
jgi:protein-S-isoprenylcysteine O-methyltransferase Ste14